MNKYILLFLTLLSINIYACEEESKSDCSNSTWNPSSENTSANLKRFYALNELMDKQFTKSNYYNARKLANEYLQLALLHNQNWNYGNAIHDANRILGLMSLNEGNIEEAAAFLLKSSESRGSPQLDTFGPELDLANLLLKEGKTVEVKTYLTNIKNFWEMDNGVVTEWLDQIELGKSPELNRFGQHLIPWNLRLFIWFSLLWPLLITIGIYIKFHKTLIHWKFISITTICAYITMVVGSFISRLIYNSIFNSLSGSFVAFSSVILSIIQFLLPLVLVYWMSKIKFFHR
jgi:hypothetical protein